jgi:acyl-CoA dehydrogenase
VSWDFSTEPEFERQLEWMRAFVREEIWPIETIQHDIGQAELDRIYAPLQEQVREHGLWAAHLPRDLGGQGFGQVKLGLMNEILGTSIFAPNAFGCQAPDSGNSEIIALAGTPEQKERWLYPLLAGQLKSAFSMTEPEVAGSDPTGLRARAVRDGDGYVLTGHKWFTSNGSIADFLIVMAVTDPDAAPHRRASMFIVPVDAPGVNIVRDVPNMEHLYPHFGMLGGHTEIFYGDVRLGREALLRRRGRGVRDRPEAARARAHPPLHALARRLPARVRHALRALALPTGAGRAAPRQADGCRTGSPTRRRRCRRRGS